MINLTPNIPEHLRKYVTYILNATGGSGVIRKTLFEDDLDPIGRKVFEQMQEAKLIAEIDGMLLLNYDLCRSDDIMTHRKGSLYD